MSKPLAFSYVRFSSEAQAGGDSLRRQKAASEEYARKHGLQLVTDFNLTDKGVSAFKGKHAKVGALSLFLTAVNEGRIPQGSVMLIESLDRLSRQEVTTAFNQLSNIIHAGITVVTISDQKVYTAESLNANFADLIIALSVMFRAYEESQRKSERVHAAWSQKRKNAHEKKLTVMCPNWMRLSDDRRSFILHDDHVQTIKRIFEMAINGRGVRVVTSILNQEKVPTYGRNSTVWAESTVKKILKSRTVLGEYQPCRKLEGRQVPDGDVVENYYPRIIDDQTFNLVQAAMRERRVSGAGRKGDGVSDIFSGLLRCGYCGDTMRYLNKGASPKGGQYLICVNSQNGMGCSNRTYRYKLFERQFLNYVRDMDLRSLIGGAEMASEEADLQKSIAAIKEGLNASKDRIRNYLLKIEENPDLEEIYTERMLELRKSQKEAEGQMATLTSRLKEVLSQGSNVSDVELNQIIDMFQSGDGDRMKLASRVKSLVSRIIMFNDGRKSKNMDFVDDPAVLEAAKNDSSSSHPYMIIHFTTGDVQIVVPDYENPPRIAFSAKAGKDRHMIIHDLEFYGNSDDLADISAEDLLTNPKE